MLLACHCRCRWLVTGVSRAPPRGRRQGGCYPAELVATGALVLTNVPVAAPLSGLPALMGALVLTNEP